MAVKYPKAQWRPLGSQAQAKMRKHDIICLHTMVGYLTSTDVMFKKDGYKGTESHFGIGGKWGGDASKNLDGIVYQWQDLDYTADANLDGNHRVLSIETADNAPRLAKDIAPWTPKQLDAIVLLVAWMCEKYDIPPKLIPDTKAGRRGIAYHRQGCDPASGPGTRVGFRVVGGEKWSSALGKECPGEARIKQLIDVVIPRVAARLNPQKESQTDMPLTEKEMDAVAAKTVALLLNPATKLTLSAAEAENMSSAGTVRKEGEKVSFRYFISWGGGGVYRLFDRVSEIQKALAVSSARKAVSDVYGAIPTDQVFTPSADWNADAENPYGVVIEPAPAGGVAAWRPAVRHLMLGAIALLLSWLSTVVVPLLNGQTGYGALLAGLLTAAIAYFTPLVPSYGVGKPDSSARHATRKPPVPLD